MVIVVLMGSGCNSLLGIDELTKIDGGDPGPIDAPVVDALGDECFGTLAQICFAPADAIPETISGTIDTNSVTGDSRCRTVTPSNGVEVCAIVGSSISIPSGGATVSGMRPLMLVSTTTITIAGALDALRPPGSHWPHIR